MVINFLGKVDGEAFEGGSAEDFPLTLGSNQFIPGFEDQLVGIKAGEDKAVEVTFPEDGTPPDPPPAVDGGTGAPPPSIPPSTSPRPPAPPLPAPPPRTEPSTSPSPPAPPPLPRPLRPMKRKKISHLLP